MTTNTPTDWLASPAIQVLTKGEAVYRELSRRILDGTLEPGSSVNQEALAATMGVSITPLREALRRLDAEGLVIVEPNRTLTIAPLSVHEVRELYAVRLQLDPFAAGLAAANASPETIARITAMAERETEETTQGRLFTSPGLHGSSYSIHRAPGSEASSSVPCRITSNRCFPTAPNAP